MEKTKRESKCLYDIVLLRDNLLLERRPKRTKGGIILPGATKNESASPENTDVFVVGYGELTEGFEIGDKVLLRPGALAVEVKIKTDKEESKTSLFAITDQWGIIAIDKRPSVEIEDKAYTDVVKNKKDDIKLN